MQIKTYKPFILFVFNLN